VRTSFYGTVRSTYTFFQPNRHLMTLRSFTVRDVESKLGAVILETANDQNVSQHEKRDSYVAKSYSALANAVPVDLHGCNLIWSKISTSVIDYSAWNAGRIKPIWTGHLIVGLGSVTLDNFNPYADTMISKVDNKNSFQADAHILNYELISSRQRYSNAIHYNSKEYFCFVKLDKTIIKIDEFKERVSDLKKQNRKYHPYYDACTQAGFEVMTGKSGDPASSSQTGFINGLFGILSSGNVFESNLRDAILASGLYKKAYILGKELQLTESQKPNLSKRGK
jgi:hypothetical protein